MQFLVVFSTNGKLFLLRNFYTLSGVATSPGHVLSYLWLKKGFRLWYEGTAQCSPIMVFPQKPNHRQIESGKKLKRRGHGSSMKGH